MSNVGFRSQKQNPRDLFRFSVVADERQRTLLAPTTASIAYIFSGDVEAMQPI